MSAANQLALTNIINVSAVPAASGIGSYNTSNLAIFTDEVPGSSFGTLGYAAYVSPSQVATDFGSSSKTYAMANAVFSQQPNILAGGGQLIVILMTAAIQHIAFSGTAASGTFILNFGGDATAAINWNDTAAQIQTKVRTITGLEEAIVTGSIATSLNIQMSGVYGQPALMTVTSNTLATSGPVAITLTVTTTTVGESLDDAITRTVGLVQYFGVMCDANVATIGQSDMLAAAAVIQALNKIAFFVSSNQADIASGGALDLLRSGSFTQSRGLYYGDSDELNDIVMMASYAGAALSVNFSGSNTTITMNLKVLNAVPVDPTITQTIQNLATAAGADTYVSLQGVPAVLCSGANSYFDQVYNLQWFVGALQVAGFNFLQSVNTKVPQTENGMDGLKGAYRAVCEQAITNQYGAPGAWNSATTFGNQADLIANVAQRGYYIYSVPIAKQAQTDRIAREAPLVQIAFKEAGAIQSSSIIVNVNA